MLLVTLVGPLGLAGAGIALCGAYVVMLTFIHLLTRRHFAVSFEWVRLTQLVLVVGGFAVVGNLLLPTHGALGLLSRLLVCARDRPGAAGDRLRPRGRAAPGASAGPVGSPRGRRP